ncbi:MAG: hypothetical protein L6R40_007425 [Gallowayella cf. fulva]|nr:MAG: hypothetical protein L6R40_007425 [Xanthomendoza cf. fulva]
MTDALYELLAPYFDPPPSPRPLPTSSDPVASKYLSRLSTLSLSSLITQEPQSLAQLAHSTLLSIQSLSSRSHTAIVAAADHFSTLEKETLPLLAHEADQLQIHIPKLDQSAATFSTTYSRSTENAVLDRRKKALLMERNADRLSDILDLPTLLSSAISSSAGQGTSNVTNYASALNLYSHIKRLHLLYPESPLILSIYAQTESAMRDLTSHLITSLRQPNIKLAAGMRTIGWLRRVAPELEATSNGKGNQEGLLGYLFLVCRLSTLVNTLSALEPLRQLADQESETRLRNASVSTRAGQINGSTYRGGQQSERYLKKYIEVFRDQSFSIISVYKSIFGSTTDGPSAEEVQLPFRSSNLQSGQRLSGNRPAREIAATSPSALSTFPSHLTDLLFNTLNEYLPNVQDKTSKESLLTQVLYCAGSLGRLGGDFSLMLTMLSSAGSHLNDSEEDENAADGDWVEVMKKHRELAGRLEALASGVGVGKGADRGGSVRIKS